MGLEGAEDDGEVAGGVEEVAGGVEVAGGGVEVEVMEVGLGLQRPDAPAEEESLRLRLAMASCPWT